MSCSVVTVRDKIFSSTLTDLDIINIISEVSQEVMAIAGTTDQSNPHIILAVKYAAYAATLQKMKTTGEMAANVKQGNSQQQNQIDVDITKYEEKRDFYIKMYRMSSFSISSGRMGHGTVNNTEGFS